MPYCFEFHSRSLNNKINWVHERCSRIIYNEKRLNFEDNSKFKDNSVSTHRNNTNSLAIEMCEAFHAISPEIMSSVFQIRNNTHYNTRYVPTFLTEPIHNVFNGSESVFCLGSRVWEQIPNNVKMRNPLSNLKTNSESGNQ